MADATPMDTPVTLKFSIADQFGQENAQAMATLVQAKFESIFLTTKPGRVSSVLERALALAGYVANVKIAANLSSSPVRFTFWITKRVGPLACLMLCAALAGCDLQMPAHCDTVGGLQVYGTDQACENYSLAESLIVAKVGHALAAGWYIEAGRIAPDGTPLTDCALRTTWIRAGNLTDSGLFHELMHVADDCVTPNHEGWNEPGAQRDQWVSAAQQYQALVSPIDAGTEQPGFIVYPDAPGHRE